MFWWKREQATNNLGFRVDTRSVELLSLLLAGLKEKRRLPEGNDSFAILRLETFCVTLEKKQAMINTVYSS